MRGLVRYRFAEYQPVPGGRRHARVFRTVRLNLLGRSAVVLLVLAGAALGIGVTRMAGSAGALGGLAGASAALAGLIALDRRRLAQLRRSAGRSSDARSRRPTTERTSNGVRCAAVGLGPRGRRALHIDHPA